MEKTLSLILLGSPTALDLEVFVQKLRADRDAPPSLAEVAIMVRERPGGYFEIVAEWTL